MEIVYQSTPSANNELGQGIYVSNDKEAFEFGKKVGAMKPFESPKENMVLFARKP
jgi:hypothetical protein